MSERLSPGDWIDAGLRALASEGVDAVRVERLAKALKVTKGGFYWHFRDREALLAALLEAWKNRATKEIIAMIEEAGGDARARLRRLFRVVFQSDGRLERAIRDWAARDAMAMAAQRTVDGLRLDYLEKQFIAMGLPPAQAAARALLAYQALIGKYAMARSDTRGQSLGEYLDRVLPLLVPDT